MPSIIRALLSPSQINFKERVEHMITEPWKGGLMNALRFFDWADASPLSIFAKFRRRREKPI